MAIGDVVGRVDETKQDWYLLDDGKLVTFHKAFFEHPAKNPKAQSQIFYSDIETYPGVTAQRLGISYVYLRNCTPLETEAFLRTNGNNITVKEVIWSA